MEVSAVHSQDNLGRTGILSVTPRGIHFKPLATDRQMGGKEFSIAATEIADVSIAPRSFWPLRFDGRIWRRLQVRTRGQGTHFFLTKNVDSTAARVREIILTGRGPDSGEA